MNFITLVLSLPTQNATLRQRAWRTLKASGAAVLRDGVYLMPDRETYRLVLKTVAAEVIAAGGTAHVLRTEPSDDTDFARLFDRSIDFAKLMAGVAEARTALAPDVVNDTLKQVRKLRKSFASLAEIDFFPGEAQRQTEQVLRELELQCTRMLSPDEPQAVAGTIQPLQVSDFHGRVWATRQRPWVDRLASAWLIRRHIDPKARILWLKSPAECPPDALGFDFDGATFSHVGGRVTFEVLLATFGLEQAAFTRIGQLVHFLDVGGVQAPEAPGLESILAGMRQSIADDEQLLAAASLVFDSLLTDFDKGTTLT